jgi:uncharacterized protein
LETVLLSLLIFVVSIISGMLGIGVAFAAIPILGMHSRDLVHEVQPIALFLNGITALFAAVAFERAGYVDWRPSITFAAVCTVFAPLGAWAAQHADERVLWTCYFGASLMVIYLLVSDRPPAQGARSLGPVLAVSAPIASLSGFLGVGPGFLLVPAIIYSGISPRRAAAMNAVAVTPASFVSLIPHFERATVDLSFAGPVVLSAAIGALAGGFLASRRVPEKALRKLFIAIILVLAAYKLAALSVHQSTALSQPAERALEAMAPRVK